MNTLPILNISYWLIMLLCTTMGELIGNLISRNFELGYTQGAMIDVCIYGIVISLVLFFKFKNHIFYWILILIGNIGGTNLADWVILDPLANDKRWAFLQPLELGTKWGSIVVMASLILALVIRYFSTRKRGEGSILSSVFYWIAILLSSTFGTTSGDFITNDTPLGALGGSMVLIVLLVFTYTAFKFNLLSKMSTYWISLVLIHPVGATIGNYISKPIGLNLGNVYTNFTLGLLLIAVYLNNSRLVREIEQNKGRSI